MDFVKVRAAFFCLSYYVSFTTEPRFSTAIDIEKDYFLENNMIYCLRLFTALCWTKIHAFFLYIDVGYLLFVKKKNNIFFNQNNLRVSRFRNARLDCILYIFCYRHATLV